MKAPAYFYRRLHAVFVEVICVEATGGLCRNYGVGAHYKAQDNAKSLKRGHGVDILSCGNESIKFYTKAKF